MPKVSVIVPVYNVELYLTECIESILNQTFSDIEVICVNDGSTDKSSEILMHYAAKDSRISIIEQANQGLSAARNVGIKKACGQYLIFVDSDDIIDKYLIEKCYDVSTKEKSDVVLYDAKTMYDFNFTGKRYVSNEVSRYMQLTYDSQSNSVFEQLLTKSIFQASACLIFIRSDYLKSINLCFKEGLLFEDELFTPQLFSQTKFLSVIPECLYCRRLRNGSIMTTRNAERDVKIYHYIICELLAYARNCDKQNKELIKLRVTQLSEYVLSFYNGNEFDISLERKLIFRKKINRIVKKLFTGEFIRFCIVGVLATALHYGLYWLFINLITPTHIDNTLWINIAYAIGYVISFCCNFLLSNYFTFRTKPDFVKLLGMAGAHGLNFLNHMLLLNFFVWLGVSENLAPIPVYLIAVPINFIMVRFAFKHKWEK